MVQHVGYVLSCNGPLAKQRVDFSISQYLVDTTGKNNYGFSEINYHVHLSNACLLNSSNEGITPAREKVSKNKRLTIEAL